MYLQERISEEINRKCDLKMTSNEKYELLLKLQKIDKVLEKINEKWKRKRLINISYLIKRVLSEHDKSRADKIQLHLSEKILKFYDERYDNFQTTIILYKICIKFKLHLHEKTNTILQSQIQEQTI